MFSFPWWLKVTSVWERVICLPDNKPTFSCTQSRLSTTLQKNTLENMMGKGENAGNQYFILFTQCFPRLLRLDFDISVAFIVSSANALNLDQPKTLSFGGVR